MGAKRLRPVPIAFNWTSLVGALEGVLRAAGEAPSSAYLMGVTGFAFRLALTSEDGVLFAGPAAAAFDLRRTLALIRNTGLKLEPLDAAATDRDYAKRRDDALKRIRKSIDRGRPALAYNLHIPEWGVIWGYDDRARTLTVSSMMSGQYGETLAESRWPVPERPGRLLALLVEGRAKVDPARARRDALTFALAYAEHGDPGDPTDAAHGLAAFARWSDALASEAAIEPAGHAHAIQTVQTARRDAARFLREMAPDLPDAAPALTEAAAAYDRVALAFSRLATLFPYPAGGDIGSRGTRLAALGSLRAAEAEERAALDRLAAAARAL
jgi:hypothetical protein